MGLMQHARLSRGRATTEADDKKKNGLLRTALGSSAYDTVARAFRAFLTQGGFERGGVLFPSLDGIPCLVFSTGFDLTTSYRFTPERSQLISSGESDAWTEISGERLLSLGGNFSSHELESLQKMYARPIEGRDERAGIVVVADSLLDGVRGKRDIAGLEARFADLRTLIRENASLFSSLTRVSSINPSRDAIVERVKSALASGKIATLATIRLDLAFDNPESITVKSDAALAFSGIVHRIARQAGSMNIVYVREDHSLRIVLFSSSAIDMSLYFSQLLKPLEPLFGANRVSRMESLSSGASDDIREITDFVFGER